MKKYLITLGLLVTWLAACSPTVDAVPEFTQRPTRAGTLQPYSGPTPSATPSPTAAATATPLPTATPTPRTHVVQRNEDLWGIALRYGVTLDDLMTANPTVNPRVMRVGERLVIPAPLYTPTIDPNNPPLPTPVTLSLAPPNCAASAGGLWCFSSASNPQTFDIEGLTAVIRLYNPLNGEIQDQTAYPPLNLLPAGGFLPLAAYFLPPTPEHFEVSIELVSALPVPPESNRYLSLMNEIHQNQISPDGLSALVSGTLSIAEPDRSATLVSVAAAAYDQAGNIVGIRLWEHQNRLESGSSLEYNLTVYSAGTPIDRVVVLAEAIP